MALAVVSKFERLIDRVAPAAFLGLAPFGAMVLLGV